VSAGLPTIPQTLDLLVIEDDRGFSAVLQKTLGKRLPALSVAVAPTLEDGLARLRAGGANLVLLDLGLPDSQGLGALGRLREEGGDPVVVILTARAEEDLALQAIRQGAQDYLVKGELNDDILVRTIRHTLERRHWQAELRRAEARRLESHGLLACTLDAMKAAIAIAGEDGILLEANAAWKAQAGNPLIPAWDAGHRDYAGFCLAVVQEGGPAAGVAGEILAVLAGAEERFVQDFQMADDRACGVTVFSFVAGGARRVGVAVADITARLQTERSLRENQELFRLISEHAGDAVAIFTRSGRRVYQNHAYGRDLGYTDPELAGLGQFALLHPEDRDRVVALLEELFSAGETRIATFRMRHKSGEWRHFEARGAPVAGTGAGPDLAILVARDVTDRMAADLELLRAHAIKNLILENSTLGIAFVRKRVFEWANSRTAELVGRPLQEILGRPTRILYPDDASYEEMGRTTYPNMREGVRADLTWQLVRGDGKLFWCRMIGRPLDLDRPDEGSVWMLEDITDRINAEQERLSLEVQLRHAQKLEAIGQLAAGIAHEINTPTQYIGDNTKFLAEACRDVFKVLDAHAAGAAPEALRKLQEEADLPFLRDEIPKAIEQTLEGIARVTKIVRAMKDFSHPGSEQPVRVDLNHSIESTITVSRNEWKYVADLVMELDPELPAVTCFPNEMNQVILNLVVNAAHAIADAPQAGPDGKGAITVSTTRAGDLAEIRVRDTGTGIPEHVRSRIFDPFFTTKGVGKGTGQGLAIVHSVVVERHHGTIAFETELGRGSVFILKIPIAGPQEPNP